MHKRQKYLWHVQVHILQIPSTISWCQLCSMQACLVKYTQHHFVDFHNNLCSTQDSTYVNVDLLFKQDIQSDTRINKHIPILPHSRLTHIYACTYSHITDTAVWASMSQLMFHILCSVIVRLFKVKFKYRKSGTYQRKLWVPADNDEVKF